MGSMFCHMAVHSAKSRHVPSNFVTSRHAFPHPVTPTAPPPPRHRPYLIACLHFSTSAAVGPQSGVAVVAARHGPAPYRSRRRCDGEHPGDSPRPTGPYCVTSGSSAAIYGDLCTPRRVAAAVASPPSPPHARKMPLTKAAKSANDGGRYGSAGGWRRLIFICSFLRQRAGELSYGSVVVRLVPRVTRSVTPDA